MDASSSEYWWRHFPHSDWHGGGPLTLEQISKDKAKELFPNLF
jgi:hypothetical protein